MGGHILHLSKDQMNILDQPVLLVPKRYGSSRKECRPKNFTMCSHLWEGSYLLDLWVTSHLILERVFQLWYHSMSKRRVRREVVPTLLHYLMSNLKKYRNCKIFGLVQVVNLLSDIPISRMCAAEKTGVSIFLCFRWWCPTDDRKLLRRLMLFIFMSNLEFLVVHHQIIKGWSYKY